MKPADQVNEPDRRGGGTFVRNKEGKLLEHKPPTRDPRYHQAKSAPETPTAETAPAQKDVGRKAK